MYPFLLYKYNYLETGHTIPNGQSINLSVSRTSNLLNNSNIKRYQRV